MACSPETVTWSLMNCVSGSLMSSSSGFCDRRLNFWHPASARGSIQHKNRRRPIPMVVRLLCASALCRWCSCGNLSKVCAVGIWREIEKGRENRDIVPNGQEQQFHYRADHVQYGA